MKLRFAHLQFFVATVLALTACSTSRQPVDPKFSLIQTNLIALPEAVTSFGAVTSDEWLYVFGGHKGERHDYSADMVSGSFHRLKLSDGRTWQSLPPAPAAQGLALVAHNGYIYRIGGM